MRAVFIIFLGLYLTACASMHRTAVPAELALSLEPIGMTQVRTWANGPQGNYDGPARMQKMLSQYEASNGPLSGVSKTPAPIAILALSGGGDSGAFGAGLLTGWSEAGDRPDFQLVTGVSTGALIAPFAFLGEDYDSQLKRFYTETKSSQIFSLPIIPNFLKGAGLAHSDPLAKQIKMHITPELIDKVAKEHAAGRRLMIVTTNLDTGRAVLWDMGAIASRGGPAAGVLFRKIMLASASVPGLMPPVKIDVGTVTNSYTELHADGGITANVFAYKQQLDIGTILRRYDEAFDVTLYVVRNGRQNCPYDPPKPVWYNLMQRAMNLLLMARTNTEIEDIYKTAKRDGLNFRLAAMPNDYADTPKTLFDQRYMVNLFSYAQTLGREGYAWQTTIQPRQTEIFSAHQTPAGTAATPACLGTN